MKRPFLSPGCWGSVLAAQASSEACNKCSYKGSCFTYAAEAEPAVMETIQRKLRGWSSDQETVEAATKKTNRHFARRKLSAKKFSEVKRSDWVTKRFQDNGIDPTVILSGVNPFDATAHPIWHDATQLVLTGEPFKAKDVLMDMRPTDLTTASLKSEVSRFITALVNANVLERKERNIVCLSQ